MNAFLRGFSRVFSGNFYAPMRTSVEESSPSIEAYIKNLTKEISPYLSYSIREEIENDNVNYIPMIRIERIKPYCNHKTEKSLS